MLSFSEENHLKSIFHLSIDQKNGVSTNAIAESLKTKAPSVTDMLKKLCDKEEFFIESLYSCSVLVVGNGSLVVANYCSHHRGSK